MVKSSFSPAWLVLFPPGPPSAPALISAPVAQGFGQVAVNGTSPATQILGYSSSGTTTPTFSLAYGVAYSLSLPQCSGVGTFTCTVSVSFQPHAPGLQRDAVLVKDNAGNVLGTTFLYGTGMGPQLTLFPGVISTVVGTGLWGYSGDNGLATSATLRNPQSIAIDTFGNLYIADVVNQVVRKVNAITGRIGTFAGTGATGYTGDGGPAARASLNTPTALALDGAGNLYIADEGNNVIRKVSATTQQITTFAGGGPSASGLDGLGDGGLAVNALLSGPNDIALDGAGNLYIADSYSGTIRRVDAASGIITVVAGGGNNPGVDGLGDGGPAIEARLNNPLAIALDATGNLYVADSDDNMVRRVDAGSGVITVVAGTGKSGSTGDFGPAPAASVGSPSGLRIDAAGNLYIADKAKNVIRQVNAASGNIITAVGSGPARYSGDGGIPTAASLNNPAGLALDSAGNLYIADLGNNVIRKIALQGSSLTFPSTSVGQASAAQVISVTNTGNKALNFSGVALSANFIQPFFSGFDCSSSTILASAAVCTVAVQFVPTKAGLVGGSLSLTSNAPNASSSTQVVVLSGAATTGAVPQIVLSSTVLSFGNQALATTSTASSFTVSNAGGAPLYISSIQLGGTNAADFTLATNCGNVVAPGANCSISVTFAPSAPGPRNASVILVDNVAFSPQVVVNGTGTGVPQASINSTVLQFGSQSIGGPASVKSVLLSDPGSGSLTIAGMSLSGPNAADFGLTTACGAVLAANASCSVSISFSPRAIGLRTASLTVTDNAANSTQTIQIRGVGSPKSLPTVWRPSNGTWYVSAASSSASPTTVQWGLAGDIPVSRDYDGDGKMDLAVWRPSNGTWYVIPSTTGRPYSLQFGLPGDVPVPGDYDGDGKTDVAVWRTSNGTWYILPSTTGVSYNFQWGLSGDVPVPSDYDGDGRIDVAVYRPSTGDWFIVPSSAPNSYTQQRWGIPNDVPVPSDYNGDGKTDIAVYRPSNGNWYIAPNSPSVPYTIQWGIPGDISVQGN